MTVSDNDPLGDPTDLDTLAEYHKYLDGLTPGTKPADVADAEPTSAAGVGPSVDCPWAGVGPLLWAMRQQGWQQIGLHHRVDGRWEASRRVGQGREFQVVVRAGPTEALEALGQEPWPTAAVGLGVPAEITVDTSELF